MFATLQIDLSVIGRLMRENPNIVRKVQFKDGQHQLLNIAVSDKKEADRFGNNLKVDCRPKDAPKDNKWFIGQGKQWEEHNQGSGSTSAPTPPPSPSAPSQESDNLPF